jgi:GxxExxY protein
MSLDANTEKIANEVINIAMMVHKTMGPGLLESAYKECLYYELDHNGLFVEKEKPIPLLYKEIKLDCGYRADLIVENKILLELKSIEELTKIHLAQMLTYLRIGGYRLGFLMNFNVLLFKNGIQRVIL